MDKKTYFWIMFGLAIITIVCGIVTVCAPSLLWKVMNFVLGFLLVLSGISAIINAIKNKGVQYIGFLLAIGILITIFGFMLICGRGNFIGTLAMWFFALWALMRGCILIFNGLQTKAVQKWWLFEVIVGGLLIILSIFTAFNTGEAANFAGVCIGISIIFDGVALCMFAFRIKNADSIQMQVINQAAQQEIGQGDIVIEETVIIKK